MAAGGAYGARGSWKEPVKAAVTTNLTLSGTQTIDGIACVEGDEVGAFGQSTGAENGPYVCSAGAWTRRADWDASGEAQSMSAIPIAAGGTTNGGKVAWCTTQDTITIGTTATTWVVQSAPSASYVTGPASATDNAAARFDSTTGKLLQNGVVLIGDTGAVSGVTTLGMSGALTVGTTTKITPEAAATAAKIELAEATDNGVNKVTLAAPAALAANRTITVPDADVTLADIATNKADIAAAVSTSAGGGDAAKLVELDGSGLLGASMQPAYTGPITVAAGGVATVVGLVAEAAVIGGIPVVHMVDVPSGANGDVDVVLTHKTRVLGCAFIMRGGGTAGSLLTVKNGATAITNAGDVSAATDKTFAWFTEIDDAQYEIAAAGTLRISKASTGGDFPGAKVFILGVKVA